jgi:hypothetical protein
MINLKIIACQQSRPSLKYWCYLENLLMRMRNQQKSLRLYIFRPSHKLETFQIPTMAAYSSIANFGSLLASNRVCIWNSVNASIESTRV